MKVSPAFSKAAESRGRASGRAPQSAELSCAHKSAGGGPRGNPRRGFPLLFTLLRVRRFIGRWSMAPAAFRPHFFGACPKKRCRAAKEKRFLPWWLHHSRERCRSVDYTFLARLGEGLGAGLGWMGQKGHKIPPLDIRLRLLYTFSALCATNSKEANRMMRTRINRSVMGISVFSGGPSRSACP